MPTFNRRLQNNQKSAPPQSSRTDFEDMQIDDFSDETDIEGLGALLGGGISFGADGGNALSPESDFGMSEGFVDGDEAFFSDDMTLDDMPMDYGFSSGTRDDKDLGKSLKTLFNAIADRVKSLTHGKREKKDNDTLSTDFPDDVAANGFSPNSVDDWGQMEGQTVFSDLPQPPSEMAPTPADSFPVTFGEDRAPAPEMQKESDIAFKPFDVGYRHRNDGLDHTADSGASYEDLSMYDHDWNAVLSPDADVESAALDEATDHSRPAEPPTGLGAVLAALRLSFRKFRRRLPSFKPKVYTIPEPQYEPQQDGIQPPTLAHDIEKIIHKQNELGDVVREYEEMRSYINSVRTDTRLSRRDIPPPPNYHEVQAAQDELLDMINEISAQNEQQRSRIGVYELPKEEDPYNYRGINDDRQNYTDIEGATFSMQPRLSFESEQRVDMERQYAQRREQPLFEPQQAYGGSQFSAGQASSQGQFDPYGLPNGGSIPKNNGFSGGFSGEEIPTGDGADSDLTDDFGNDFAGDFADDFDQAIDGSFGGGTTNHDDERQPQGQARRFFDKLRGR